MVFRNILSITPDDRMIYSHARGFREDDPVSHLEFIPLIRRHGIRQARRMIVQAVKDKRPDLVLVVLLGDNYQFPVDFFVELRELAPLVLWFYDDENYLEVHAKYYGQAADVVMTTDYFGSQTYSRMGVPGFFYPPGDRADVLRPVAVPAQDIDVCFLGDCTKSDRLEYIDFLRSNGVKVEAYGRGSENGYVERGRMAEIFCRSKINLNFSKTDDLSWINESEPLLRRVRQNKGRPIEIALTRSFCLTEYYPALPHVFEPGKEIDFFHDKASLLEKVRRYLAHDDERRSIAESAYRRAVRDYQAHDCLGRALEKIDAALRERRGPALSTAYINATVRENRINVLFVHLLSALRRGQPGIACEIFPELFQYGPGPLVKGTWGGLRRAANLLRKRAGAAYGPVSSTGTK